MQIKLYQYKKLLVMYSLEIELFFHMHVVKASI